MKIISVVNGKGGVGKSTVARGIASGLKAEGFKVAVLDLDLRQKTCLNWYTQAKASGLEGDAPAVISADAPQIGMIVKGLSDDFDVLVIDTLGTTSGNEAVEIIVQSLKMADLFIIPLNPASADELDATRSLDGVIKKVLADHPEKQARYLLSRMNPRNTNWEIESVLSFKADREARGFALLTTPMYLREQYLKTQAVGATPLALRKSDPARQNLEELTQEIMDVIGLHPKKKGVKRG